MTITGDAVGECSPLDTDTVNVKVLPARSQIIDAVERAPVNSAVSFAAVLGDEAGTVEPMRYDCTFSDGGTAEGAEVSYAFAEAGAYLAKLTTTLEGGTQDCGQLVTRHKILINAAPTPGVDAPAKVAAGVLARFDATDAIDSDGVITRYFWDFGDGQTAEGVSVVHRYERPSVYALTLEVTDDAGVANSSATWTREMQVNRAPLTGVDVAGALCAGEDKAWELSVGPGVAVAWDFGDGGTGKGAAVTNRYATPGLYPVTVSTDDGKGLENSSQLEQVYARVNAPPTADAGPDRVVCPGEEVAFRAEAYDVDGKITDLLWRFSDGVELSGADVSRRFDNVGPVTATLIVTDDSGATCAVVQDTAEILVNAAPVISAGQDRETPVGAAHDVLRFDVSDVRDPDGHGVEISWQFGDGAGGYGAVTRHAYGAPGTYTATVTARDSTGLACGVSTDSVQVLAVARGEGN